MSLRTRLALVIALLAFLPNLVLALTLGLMGEGPWLPLVLWLLLIGLVSGAVGYFLARSLLRPLEELTRALAYLSVREGPVNELRLPAPKEPPPMEIALLRARFGELLQRLQRLMEAREAFYGALAHDLKTPLLSAIRALEYLERADHLGREKRVELLLALRRELFQAHLLVENLLALSRLETRTPQRETLNLRALAEDLLLRYREEAGRRGLGLTVEGAGPARGSGSFWKGPWPTFWTTPCGTPKPRCASGWRKGPCRWRMTGKGFPCPWRPWPSPSAKEARTGEARGLASTPPSGWPRPTGEGF